MLVKKTEEPLHDLNLSFDLTTHSLLSQYVKSTVST